MALKLGGAGYASGSPPALACRIVYGAPQLNAGALGKSMASLATENDLHRELLSLYTRTGGATGYWAHYFLREGRKYGGLAVAKKLLRANRISTGFERLIAARRADLSIEAIALSSRFKHLFSAEERAVAAKRIEALPRSAFRTNRVRNPAFPTDLVGDAYSEGSVERVSVNQYERNGRARVACIRHHGARLRCLRY